MKKIAWIITILFFAWANLAQAQNLEEQMEAGRQYVQKGNYKKALKCFTKAIELDPNAADAYHERGQVYYELQEYAAVIADSEKALHIRPDIKHAYFNIAISHYRLDKYAASIQNFDKMIALYPQDFEALYWRGMAYMKVNKMKEACADWELSRQLGNGAATNLLHKYCEPENAVEGGDKGN